ncbi:MULTISPECIES: hypothetical protein [unclassified Thiocapsa]|uniref:hypothetical protein n=1 Tax=unclassified Thiocapsa TaxID=2641286 RepID=UPI0035B35911
MPLNDANFDLEVNFLEYREHAPDGSVTHFSWVTDIPVEDTNLMTLMRGARARWKIENGSPDWVSKRSRPCARVDPH